MDSDLPARGMSRTGMIEVEGLSKDYGTGVAVSDLSFRVERGEIVGFLGPNGAGKTTTLRIIAGALGPSSGTVRVNGYDILEDPMNARRAIGYMPEATPLYPEMRVSEYLQFRAALKEVPRRERKRNVERALERANVADVATVPIGHLSKGYRQRVGLADALVADPPLFILDEPTAGLDPNQIREVRALIRELGGEHTVFVSTHILSEIEALCDRALVIHRGSLVAEGAIGELRARSSASSIEIVVRDTTGRAAGLIGDLPDVEQVTSTPLDPKSLDSKSHDGVRLVIRCNKDASIEALSEAIVKCLVDANVGVQELRPGRSSLEDVFAELTQAPTVAEAETTPLTSPRKGAS